MCGLVVPNISLGCAVSSFSGAVTKVMGSTESTLALFRLISNISALAKGLFSVREWSQIRSLRTAIDVIVVARSCTFSNYICTGEMVDDIKQYRFLKVVSFCFWTISDALNTCCFFYPRLVDKSISILNVQTSCSRLGAFSDTIAACSDLAGRIERVLRERSITKEQVLGIVGAGSEAIASVCILGRWRMKIAVAALFALSNMTTLIAHVLATNTLNK